MFNEFDQTNVHLLFNVVTKERRELYTLFETLRQNGLKKMPDELMDRYYRLGEMGELLGKRIDELSTSSQNKKDEVTKKVEKKLSRVAG